jgi:outer membrane protein OmpA-like peptidoglycan-associated protein
MSSSQNQGRRGRSRGAGTAGGRGSGSSDSDALAGLRRAVADLDPRAFAGCFSAEGWIRVPRPEGDVVLRGPVEIEQAARELRALLADLTWTPSARFVASGQVVEEAVATGRNREGSDRKASDGKGSDGNGSDGEIKAPMRVVAALDPAGGVGSLTLWVDWAAVRDPLGVQSARGAASALVAQARAREARGLRVIESDPESALPVPPAPEPEPVVHAARSERPSAAKLWWRQHRTTLAGSVMALAAAAVIGTVTLSVVRPIADARLRAAEKEPRTTASVLSGRPGEKSEKAGAKPAPTGKPAPSDLPLITKEKPRAKPTVQAGDQVTIQSDVLFKTNSTELTATARTALGDLAERVRTQRRNGTIQINGYTDAIGTEHDNLALSKARAGAVAEALQGELAGLPSGTVELMPQGFGESEPVGSNASTDGRRKNRRVTIVLPDPKN